MIARLRSAEDGAAGVVVLLSANPMHDTGGGQRSAQMALELLRRGFAVVFVSHGKVTETTDLGLSFDYPRLVELQLRDVTPDVIEAVSTIACSGPRFVVTQVPIDAWAPISRSLADAGFRIVYDCIDRWDSELGRGWYRGTAERFAARIANVRVASAPVLCEHVERLSGRPCVHLPNAFNATVFDPARRGHRPPDLPEGEVTLYVGALWGGWMDWSLVRASAEASPARAFVFIGDHRGEGRGLPSNCHFLGLKPQTELPPYLAHSDMAFLPWTADEVTQATSPLKVYEFLAMGLPVVAPVIEPLRGLPGVTLCDSARDFVQTATGAGRSRLSQEERSAMASFAEENSWHARLDALLELVQAPESPGVSDAIVRSGAQISVVIPAYNHEQYIGRAMDSVREQTFRADELVIVDDGSTDATASVIERHAWDAVRLVRQENRGAHRALNRAISLARGDWIAILNSDDEFEAEWLEYAWGITRASDAVLVTGGVTLIDEEGNPPRADHPITRWHGEMQDWAAATPDLRKALRRHNVAVTTSNMFMHRALWDRLGGFSDYRYVHDYDFILRAVEMCGPSVVHAGDVFGVRYRVHQSNTISESHRRASEEREEMKAGLRRMGRRLRVLSRRGRDAATVREAGRSRGSLSPDVTATVPIGDASAPIGDASAPSRVGIVVPSLGAGGLEEIVALLAQGLFQIGVPVSVLCVRAGGEVADRLRRAGVPVDRLGEGVTTDVAAWIRNRAPDVVSSHFVDADTLEAIGATGVPCIETVHNTYAWFTDADWAEERRKLDVLAATVAVSETVAEYYRTYTGSRPDHVVANAVHPGRLARVPRSFARRHLGVGEGVPLVVSVGRITEQKNPAGLLRAWRRVVDRNPDAQLLLVGPVDASARMRRLRREHRDLFDCRAVRLVPPVSDVGLVLSAADVFASNSFYEGWSVAGSEAAWMGLPLVLSETGGAAELVGADQARGRLVPNPCGSPLAVNRAMIASPDPAAAGRNEAAFAEALISVLADRDQWRTRGAEIGAWARVAVSPSALAERYVRLFGDLVAARR